MRIAIIGASNKKERMSNKAVRAYMEEGHTVFPVNPNEKEIEGIRCYPSLISVPKPIDRISLYVNPEIGKKMINIISSVNPKNVILNPGSDDNEIIKKMKLAGIKVIRACSILALGKRPQDF